MNPTLKTDEKEIRSDYEKYIGVNVERMAALGTDFVLGKREGALLHTLDGRTLIDCHCSGGQLVLGHRRPELVSALREAVRDLDLGNFVMLSAQKAALARMLSEITPGDLNASVYGVSRGESNDFAMKLARGFSGRKEIVAFEGASHGQTGFALSVSDDDKRAKLFGPLIPQVTRLPLDATALRKTVNDKTAAIIIEPILSDAGVLFPPQGLLADARKICDTHGVALIFDEGQTALGRTGKLFACMQSGVTPDILVIAKGMTGGLYPLSVAVFTNRLNRFMLMHPLIHLSTFAGADAGCMVAMACLRLIKDNKLWENAARLGMHLLEGLQDIADEHREKFREARGAGLLIALETDSPATAASYVKRLIANGVYAQPAPLNPAVVRFTPPIDITDDELDAILVAARKSAAEI